MCTINAITFDRLGYLVLGVGFAVAAGAIAAIITALIAATWLVALLMLGIGLAGVGVDLAVCGVLFRKAERIQRQVMADQEKPCECSVCVDLRSVHGPEWAGMLLHEAIWCPAQDSNPEPAD